MKSLPELSTGTRLLLLLALLPLMLRGRLARDGPRDTVRAPLVAGDVVLLLAAGPRAEPSSRMNCVEGPTAPSKSCAGLPVFVGGRGAGGGACLRPSSRPKEALRVSRAATSACSAGAFRTDGAASVGSTAASPPACAGMPKRGVACARELLSSERTGASRVTDMRVLLAPSPLRRGGAASPGCSPADAAAAAAAAAGAAAVPPRPGLGGRGDACEWCRLESDVETHMWVALKLEEWCVGVEVMRACWRLW